MGPSSCSQPATPPPQRARRDVVANQAEQSDLMIEAECAHLLRMAPKTLSNQRSRREGPPYVRLSGGAIRYSRQAVRAWIRDRTVEHGGAA